MRGYVVAFAAMMTVTAAAQEGTSGGGGPENYRVETFGPVHPVPSRIEARRAPAAPAWQPGDPVKEIPKRRKPPRYTPPPPTPALDPLLDRQQAAPRAADRAFTTPSLNITGQGYTGVNPPDTVGDVGPSHYIQMINASGGSQVAIYDKAGTPVQPPFLLDTLAASAPCNAGRGDPIVLYDHLADRWLLTEFALPNAVCLYVSQTPNPTGAYFVYTFITPNFPDYPKYSVWPDAYYITSNETGDPAVYALDRTAMLAGAAATMQSATAPGLAGFGFEALTPADLDGPPPPAAAPGIFVRHRDDEAHGGNTPSDYIDMFTFKVDFAIPDNTVFNTLPSIPVSNFDSTLCGLVSFNCFPQPGSGTTLDQLREVVMWRAQYRNFGGYQAIIGNFVTDVNGTDRGGIRWFELRNSGGGWALHQEGTYSPDAVNRWMGSIAMDGVGNIAVGYNVSDATSVYPGIRYTGRKAADPSGTMTQVETTLIAGTLANASNRYGDYSALSVDPADNCSFWFTGQHNPAAAWSTQIGRFKFDACATATTSPKFFKVGKSSLVPPGADCSGEAHYGRMVFLAGSGDLYICGASGWMMK